MDLRQEGIMADRSSSKALRKFRAIAKANSRALEEMMASPRQAPINVRRDERQVDALKKRMPLRRSNKRHAPAS